MAKIKICQPSGKSATYFYHQSYDCFSFNCLLKFKTHVYCVYCVVLYAFLMHIYQPLSTFAGADPENFERGGGAAILLTLYLVV